MIKAALAIAFAFCSAAPLDAQRAEAWLDRALTNWNVSAKGLPRAKPTGETIAGMAKRCGLDSRRGTTAERALADAGWLPYLHVDRPIFERDVEIIGGMSDADGMCRPAGFNVFVFVAGRFAGTLSPVLMTSRSDGSMGAVRLAGDDTISAEFARYLDSDALCCPSGRVSVRYRIERNNPQVLVVPANIQVIR